MLDTARRSAQRAFTINAEDSASFLHSLNAIVRADADTRLHQDDVDELAYQFTRKDPEGQIMLEPIGLNDFGRPEVRHKLSGCVFVLIPSGKFVMGSEEGDSDEQPPHEIVIDRPQLCGKYPVTQAQWRKVMGSNPSTFSNEKRKEGDETDWDSHPVETVSWLDCQEFLKKTGLRLPPEAGWEYACRAGTTERFHAAGYDELAARESWLTEEDRRCAEAVEKGDSYVKRPFVSHGGDTEEYLQKIAVFGRDYGQGHAEVGTKQPNSWGIYDCLGNVWEWNDDEYHSNYVDAPVDIRPWDKDWDKTRKDLYKIAVERGLLSKEILGDEHDEFYITQVEKIQQVTLSLIQEFKLEYWRKERPNPRWAQENLEAVTRGVEGRSKNLP